VTDRLSYGAVMTAPSRNAGTGLIRDTGRNVHAAIALLAAVIAILLAEAIAAAAWHHPSYSYADDFVSDLGVPGPATLFKGHVIHSPLAAVLNTGFVVYGVLVALAATLLLRPRDQGRMARWQRRLFIGSGLGLVLAAFLHEAPAWSLPYHALGAALIMCGGNVAVFLTGRLGPRLGQPTWLGRLFTGLGAFGFIAFVVVQVLVVVDSAVLPHNIGTLERLAAYPVLVAELVAAMGLLAESSRLRRRDLVLAR
jgi:hypothetical membrane protein